VQDGVWGATRYGFSASTSSPGWTLLLSGVIALFGRPEVWPLILNVLFATALLVVVDRLLVPSLPNPFPRFWALLFITLIVPLPILIFSGMEHVLHLLLIATVFGLLWRYEANPLESPRITRWLLVTAMLATLICYETCFLVGPLVLYYAWRHDWRMTIGLAGAVSIGPVIIGLVQVSHGWYFLPNFTAGKECADRVDRQRLTGPGPTRGFAVDSFGCAICADAGRRRLDHCAPATPSSWRLMVNGAGAQFRGGIRGAIHSGPSRLGCIVTKPT